MLHIRAALFELSARQTALVQQELIGFAHIEPREIVITPKDDATEIHFSPRCILTQLEDNFFFLVGTKSHFGEVKGDNTLKFSILQRSNQSNLMQIKQARLG